MVAYSHDQHLSSELDLLRQLFEPGPDDDPPANHFHDETVATLCWIVNLLKTKPELEEKAHQVFEIVPYREWANLIPGLQALTQQGHRVIPINEASSALEFYIKNLKKPHVL